MFCNLLRVRYTHAHTNNGLYQNYKINANVWHRKDNLKHAFCMIDKKKDYDEEKSHNLNHTVLDGDDMTIPRHV